MTKIFNCLRCGLFFDRKNKLVRHYDRQKLCKPVELDIPILILKEVINECDDSLLRETLLRIDKDLYYKYLDNQFIKKAHKKDTEEIPIGHLGREKRYQRYTKDNVSTNLSIETDSNSHLVREKNRLYCNYCNKSFSSYSSRLRHENHRCQNKQLYTGDSEKDIEIDREDLIEAVMNDKTILKDITDRMVANNTTNTNSNNTTNTNTTNSHNTNSHNVVNSHNNNYNNNINIQNIYGQENFDYIKNNKTETYLERLADTNTKKFFIELFKLAFFSKKHPENKTFELDNAKSLYIKVLEELPDKWVYAPKDETFYKKITQVLSWITDETNIVTEGTNTEKKIEDVFMEKQPAMNEVKKEFEMMEVIHYKNKKLEDKRNIAKKKNSTAIVVGKSE